MQTLGRNIQKTSWMSSNVIKIDPYNFWAIPFQTWCNFSTQCSCKDHRHNSYCEQGLCKTSGRGRGGGKIACARRLLRQRIHSLLLTYITLITSLYFKTLNYVAYCPNANSPWWVFCRCVFWTQPQRCLVQRRSSAVASQCHHGYRSPADYEPVACRGFPAPKCAQRKCHGTRCCEEIHPCLYAKHDYD